VGLESLFFFSVASDLAFDPVDPGPLSSARMLESLALLWISLAYQQKMGYRPDLVRRSGKEVTPVWVFSFD